MKLSVFFGIIIAILVFGSLTIINTRSEPIPHIAAQEDIGEHIWEEIRENFVLIDNPGTEFFPLELRPRASVIPYDDSVLRSSIFVNFGSMPPSVWEGTGFKPEFQEFFSTADD